MLQFSHFDQLLPNVLPITLEIFHIILTKLVDNTKLWDKKNYSSRVILQHNQRFDIVLHTAGLSVIKTVWQEWIQLFCCDGWMSKMTLHALNQCGRSSSCFYHQPSLSTLLETPSEAAIYLGSSCLNACWTESEISSFYNAGIFCLLCQHNSQKLMLILAYYAQNYASINSQSPNRYTAAWIPLTLLYWTTRTFFMGIKEIWTSLLLLVSSSKLHIFVYFSKNVWSNCIGQTTIAIEHVINWSTV